MSETNGTNGVVETTPVVETPRVFSTLEEAKANLEQLQAEELKEIAEAKEKGEVKKATKDKWVVYVFEFPGEEQMKELAGTKRFCATGGSGVSLGLIITALKEQGFGFQLGKAESKKSGPIDLERVVDRLDKMNPEERAALLAKYTPPVKVAQPVKGRGKKTAV